MMVQVDQSTINLLIGLAFSGLGYYLKTVQQSISNLQEGDTKLTEKIQQIELLVHGKYVTRDELKDLADALFGKLDRIEQRKETMQSTLDALFTKFDKITDKH